MADYITYYRVSTQRQGRSGLGVEAQRAAVTAFLKSEDRIVGELTETESGKIAKRPQLGAALRLARRYKATLLIAKLDRLSRNVAFLAQLLDGDVPIVACDNPNATKFTLHILAAVAEHEAAMISQRTIAALAAAKARGITLGGLRTASMPVATIEAATAGRRARAQERADGLAVVVRALRAKGVRSAADLAEKLNELDIPAARGGRWHAMTALRLTKRLCMTV